MSLEIDQLYRDGIFKYASSAQTETLSTAFRQYEVLGACSVKDYEIQSPAKSLLINSGPDTDLEMVQLYISMLGTMSYAA